MSTPKTGLVIQKSAIVSASPEKAFAVFTEGIATWWPYETHSVQAMDKDAGSPETVIFETGPNGRVYERMTSGEEAHWANVSVWEPPYRLVLEWKVNPTVAPTEIEVRFTPEGEGTRVDLEHRGFEALGKDAEKAHSSYSSGWPAVFQDYVETIGK
jgi:activator of Hsp90 ATPase-like protein